MTVTDSDSTAIVHDSEHYILEVQNREKWASEDLAVDAKVEELRAQHGSPPNIIHIMWGDTAFGDVGVPALAAIRGFDTPNLDRMRDEGIMFTRLYTESACTPSRAAVITGRHPVRHGMAVVDWPLAFGGLRGDEVTTAGAVGGGLRNGVLCEMASGDIEAFSDGTTMVSMRHSFIHTTRWPAFGIR
jgi:hypothetical protein